MRTDGGRSDSVDELVVDQFVAQLDTRHGRATFMVVACLAVLFAGYELAVHSGDASLWRLAFWNFVVLGNLVMVYVLTVYQKPPALIEREVLSD